MYFEERALHLWQQARYIKELFAIKLKPWFFIKKFEQIVYLI